MGGYVFYVTGNEFVSKEKFVEKIKNTINGSDESGFLINSLWINGIDFTNYIRSKKQKQLMKQYLRDQNNYISEEFNMNEKEYVTVMLPRSFLNYYIVISQNFTEIISVGRRVGVNLEFMLKPNPIIKNGVLTFEKRKRKIKHFY